MHLDASCPDDMVKTYTKNITKLLKSQPEIEVITFINAAVCLDRAFRILKAIRQGPCLENTLKILNLTGFFAPEDRQEETLLLCNFISEFSSLTELYLSYTSMNDRLLDSLGKYQGITLQKLGFTVNENDPDSHEISSYAWQNLLNACPNLRVEIVMKIVDKQLAVDTVLKREIPVCKLDLSLKCIGDEFTLLCEGIMEYVVKTYCNSIGKTFPFYLQMLTNVTRCSYFILSLLFSLGYPPRPLYPLPFPINAWVISCLFSQILYIASCILMNALAVPIVFEISNSFREAER